MEGLKKIAKNIVVILVQLMESHKKTLAGCPSADCFFAFSAEISNYFGEILSDLFSNEENAMILPLFSYFHYCTQVKSFPDQYCSFNDFLNDFDNFGTNSSNRLQEKFSSIYFPNISRKVEDIDNGDLSNIFLDIVDFVDCHYKKDESPDVSQNIYSNRNSEDEVLNLSDVFAHESDKKSRLYNIFLDFQSSINSKK
ncbi:hypothetical protein M9Y10_006556 [Tritrichomonas musculus]|uniref:Uncharacterized protein n=1 Tax=Tritrichomonas musculus TaxID=1915356 RepID=A0ABR2JEH3_9EUKA